MTAPWSVRPLHPAPNAPATAVTIHADDASAREGVYELARAMTDTLFEELRWWVQAYDAAVAQLGHEKAERYRVYMDAVLDEVCRANGHDLTGLWRVRVGVEELPEFRNALTRAAYAGGDAS